MNAVFLLPLLFAAVMSYPGYPSQKRVSIPVYNPAPVYAPAQEEAKEAKSDDGGHSHSFTSYYVPHYTQPQREVEEKEEAHSGYGGHQETKSAKVEVEVEEKKAAKSSGYGGYGEDHSTERLRISNEDLSSAVEKLNEQLSALTSEVKSRLEDAEEFERSKPKKVEEEEHEEEEQQKSSGGYGGSAKKSSHQRVAVKAAPAPRYSYYH